MTTTSLQEVTDATFEQLVLTASGAILVDFTAQWCPPCHALAPVLDELAREQAERLTIVKLDVDENQRVANQFGVMSFPTLILFRDGQPVTQIIGARPKARLLRELAPYLDQ
ncbi:MAG: thioredoxin [Thermomicrobiales bacterium]|jgi:thioredoxin 1|nr:thioredoxin [Thermomicrobiales bacterium]